MSNLSPQDFPGGYLSFPRPISPVPTEAIDASPLVSFCVNEHWAEYILGAIKVLSRPETWDDTYENAVIAASEIAYMQGLITDGCGVNAPSQLCISADFANLPYGVVNQSGATVLSTWVNGIGWVGGRNLSNNNEEIHLDLRFPGPTVISPYDFQFDTTIPVATQVATVTWKLNGTTVRIDSTSFPATATAHVAATTAFQADEVMVDVVCTNAYPATVKWSNMNMCYNGIFPLSTAGEFFVHTFDFAVNDGGWSGQPCASCGASPLANYVASTGWQGIAFTLGAGHEYADNIVIAFAARTLTSIDVTYDATNGNYSNGNIADAIRIYVGTTEVANQISSAPGPTGTSVHITWGGSVHADNILISIWKAHSSSSSIGSAAALIKNVVIRGIGTDPF